MNRLAAASAIGALLLPSLASADLLGREHFESIEPETFDAFASMSGLSNFDFGPFILQSPNPFDTFAFSIPFAAPVVLPAVGGDTFTMLLDEPAAAIGFDIGIVDWFAPTIEFYGEDGGVEVLLDTFVFTEILGAGPATLQGFVGYQGVLPVTRITFGQGDCYFDNVFIGMHPVPTENATWGEVKGLYQER